MRRLGSWTLLALAGILLVAAAFIHLPPYAPWLLPLAVVAPELSPLLLLASIAVAAMAVVLIGIRSAQQGQIPAASTRPSRVGRVAAITAALAALASASPLLGLSSTTARFDAVMTAALGADHLRHTSFGVDAAPTDSAFHWRRLLTGLPLHAPIVVERRRVATASGGERTRVIYRRPDARQAPVIVQIHGGAWQRGGPDDDAAAARLLASRGYVIVALDYRLAPASQWPAPLDDVRDGLAWARTHAPELGADATRLVLLGRSAGAQLALRAACAEASPDLRAVVVFYPPVDLADGWRHPPSPDPLDVRTVLEAYLGGTPERRPDAYRDASPVACVGRATPPTLILQGARDHIVEARYARQLDAHLRAAGVRSVLLEIPWAEHAFDLVPNGLSGQIALAYVERFLAWAVATR